MTVKKKKNEGWHQKYNLLFFGSSSALLPQDEIP